MKDNQCAVCGKQIRLVSGACKVEGAVEWCISFFSKRKRQGSKWEEFTLDAEVCTPECAQKYMLDHKLIKPVRRTTRKKGSSDE